MALLRRTIGGLAGLLIFPCLGWASAGIDASPLPPPSITHTITGVPFFPQKEYRCGPASLASVLAYWGEEVSLEALTDEVYLPKLKGALPLDLERAARARGLDVQTYRGSLADLRNHIALDHPVIAFLNLGSRIFPNGHFIVVTGYNDQDRKIFAHSITEPNKAVAYDEFVEGWAKTDFWMLLIHPKGLDETP